MFLTHGCIRSAIYRRWRFAKAFPEPDSKYHCKRQSSSFVIKLYDDIDLPRTAGCRVHTAAVVVSRESRNNVRRDTGGVTGRVTFTLQDVDKSLRSRHTLAYCNARSARKSWRLEFSAAK